MQRQMKGKNMRQPKKVKIFAYKDRTYEEAVAEMNAKYKIDLRHNEDLIDSICQRYPLATKREIGIVVTAIFQSFRDFLLMGKVLNFNKLFFKVLLSFSKNLGYPTVRVRMKTPPNLR
jgi:hypothetical protein